MYNMSNFKILPKLYTAKRAVVIYNKFPTAAFFNTVRCNSNTIIIERNKRLRREPREFIKWMLMVIPVTSFGLGCWQIYRLRWKLNLIANMQSKSNSTPVDLPLDFSELKSMEYMPVKVTGKFLHDKEFFFGPRSLIEDERSKRGSNALLSDPRKNQGWLVITPFQLSNTGEVILVNRGWILQSQKPKDKRQASMITKEVELTGIVRLTEDRPQFMPKNQPEKGSWLYRDLNQMSEYIDCSPVWLDVKGIPDPPDGWPIPNQTRVTLRNEHTSYIVTWFSLSIVTGFMWFRHFVRKLPLL